MLKNISYKLKENIHLMLSPDELIAILIKDQRKKRQIIHFLIIYMVMGHIFQCCWPFPHFWEFTVCFLLISIAAIWYINHFSLKMQIITSSIANQKPAFKANALYYSYGKESIVYILVPLAVVCVFGYGGCTIFGSLQKTPTLIWILSLFTITVYISIIGYLKYIVLAIYLYNLAVNENMYEKLPKSNIEYIPVQVKWIQELTKLYHTYRCAFFTIGSLYIVAYGAFCWLPSMNTNRNHPAFWILWSIISLAVVLIFPSISLLEYRWIKRIVEHLKQSYINDLFYENEHLHINSPQNSWDDINKEVITTMYAIQIMDSQDYPVQSLWNTCYTLFITAFNLLASIVTVMQGVFTPPNDFLQIF